MLSREQIESVRAMLVKGVGPMVPVFTGLCDLATKAIDTERDAALGRLARQCDPAVLDELVGDCRLHMLAPYDNGIAYAALKGWLARLEAARVEGER